MSLLIKTIDYIGWQSFIILFIVSVVLLRNRPRLLYYYLLGLPFNFMVNYLLKGMIQDPRPSNDTELIQIALHNGKRIGPDVYGMPSGHTQNAFYSIAFIHFTFNNNWLTLGALSLGLLTMYQRVKYNNHTIYQVVAGAIVGSLVGYMSHWFGFKLRTAHFAPKPDDNANVRW